MNNHVVHTALEWAKQTMVKGQDFNCLVDEDVVDLSCLWVIICQSARECPIFLATQSRGVVAMDINRTLVVEED